MKKVLIRFPHGLGDAVQLTAVLQHLRKYRPDWELYFWAKRGKHSAGIAHCAEVFHEQRPTSQPMHYDQVYRLGWDENYCMYGDVPSTKVTKCLREVFGIEPELELLRYQLKIGTEALAATGAYLESIGCRQGEDGQYNAVVVHYEGNTSTWKKNLRHEDIRPLCRLVLAVGYVPVILDWDSRSPLPDGRTIFCPYTGDGDIWGGFGSGDAERIAALISQVSLFVGVDSGPQKCAGATDTPSIGVWTGHSPVQFMDLADNFVHLIPDNWRDVPPNQHHQVAAVLEQFYRLEMYPPGGLSQALCRLALRMLDKGEAMQGVTEIGGFKTEPQRWEQDWVIVEDVYLSDCYKINLIPLSTGPEIVVDIGAHIGCFARLWHERNPDARIFCVECCPENLPLLRANVGHFATVIEAACTYEQDAWLLNSVTAQEGLTTGGSRVVSRKNWEESQGLHYGAGGQMQTITLHQIMEQHGLEQIDLLKLDCEGCEYSILAHAPVERIRFIVGESHGFARWEEFRQRLFPVPVWSYGHMSQNGDFGNFHLRNDEFLRTRGNAG